MKPNNNNNFLSLNNSISFDDEPKKEQTYRASTSFISNTSPDLFSNAFSFTNSSPKPQYKSVATASTSSFGYNPIQPLIHRNKYPEQVDIAGIDFSDLKNLKPISISTEKLSPPQQLTKNVPKITGLPQTAVSTTPEYYNEFTSYTVQNMDCSAVRTKLAGILSTYSKDIDFAVDEQNNLIQGVVFINIYAVFFMFYIWNEEDKNGQSTRFEFRRQSGDALASSKFLGDIKSMFFGEKDENFINLNLGKSLNLEALFDSMDEDEKMELMELDSGSNVSREELDELNKSLLDNDMIGVAELSYLYDKLCENGDISSDLMEHKQLIRTLINKSLKNEDICIVRGSLLILEELCVDDKINSFLNEEYKLFENIVGLLNHQSGLIKRYCIRILSKLKLNESNVKFQVNKNVLATAIELVKCYENEWKNCIMSDNDCIKQAMFYEIYQKLTECE